MKQVLQNISNGSSAVVQSPSPICGPGHLLIRSSASLISAGTERMLVGFGRASYLDKARQQPEKVKEVIQKIRTDGLLPTIDAVRSKLDEPMTMGYSNVGRVIEVGPGIVGWAIGDRIVSNGSHAEVVSVPKNLCAKIPDGVSDEDAAFTIVSAIALQGVRLAKPTIGETFAVFGLGLIGLITVQILLAQGCKVIGFDFDGDKVALAKGYGAEAVKLEDDIDPIALGRAFSSSAGIDGVILAASTKSSALVKQAAQMCRKRGRIILIGVTGLELDRADFFEKELTFQVSCSYGPGRYDPNYEEKGQDYPLAYVRWTEQRNFEAVLDLMAAGKLKLDKLRSKSFTIDEAPAAYDYLMENRDALGILLTYPKDEDRSGVDSSATIQLKDPLSNYRPRGAIIGAIGAGNYAGRVLLPAFKETGARLKSISSSGGVSGTHHGRKLGFEISTTDSATLLDDDEINTIVIGTRHNSHARFVIDGLGAGKNVFVEKPLALTMAELDAIEGTYAEASKNENPPRLMVGFNRRFSPLMTKLKSALEKSGQPISLVYTCNAGAIPLDHWTQDREIGGGRIIGEACHFVDIARFLAGAPITSVQVEYMDAPENRNGVRDTASLSLSFENGSIASIHYFANGHRSFSKERIEVFQGGNIHVIDNFRRLTSHGAGPNARLWRQDKGQAACCKAFIDAIQHGGPSPIPFDELMEVSRACVEV